MSTFNSGLHTHTGYYGNTVYAGSAAATTPSGSSGVAAGFVAVDTNGDGIPDRGAATAGAAGPNGSASVGAFSNPQGAGAGAATYSIANQDFNATWGGYTR